MDALFCMMTMDRGQQSMLRCLVFKALVSFDEHNIARCDDAPNFPGEFRCRLESCWV